MLLWHLTRIYEPLGNQFLLIELYQYVKPLVSVLSFLPPFHLVPAASLATSSISPFSLPSTWYLLSLSLSLTTSSLFSRTQPPTLPYLHTLVHTYHTFPSVSGEGNVRHKFSRQSHRHQRPTPGILLWVTLASNYRDPYCVHHVHNHAIVEIWKDEGSKMHCDKIVTVILCRKAAQNTEVLLLPTVLLLCLPLSLLYTQTLTGNRWRGIAHRRSPARTVMPTASTPIPPWVWKSLAIL